MNVLIKALTDAAYTMNGRTFDLESTKAEVVRCRNALKAAESKAQEAEAAYATAMTQLYEASDAYVRSRP